MISPAIQNTHSAEEIVNIVNAASRGETVYYFGGADSHSGDELAGQYAYSCAEEAGHGVEVEDFEVHLSTLREWGAEFDWTKALEEAVRVSKGRANTK